MKTAGSRIKNAPAGKYLIVVWHEQGFVNKLHLSHGVVKGDPIEIKRERRDGSEV